MSLEQLQVLADELRQSYHLTPRQVLELSAKPEQPMIPVAIFCSRELGVLECAVKFCKESLGMSFNDIAKAIKRDNRTIWATYDKAKKKMPLHFEPSESLQIPLSIFRNRKSGVLEALARYCVTEFRMTVAEVARLLARDQRTIWTVLHRA
jgi:hypothetical protein